MSKRAIAAACLLLALVTCRNWNSPFDPANNNPPNRPANPTPDSGAVDRDTGITLGWTCTDPDSTDTLRFDVWLGSVDSLWLRDTNLAAPQFRPGSLNHLSKYAWRVVARDRFGDTAAGPVWVFTTGRVNHAPVAPSDPEPADGAAGISLGRVLAWQSSDPDSGDVLTYDVYFGIDSVPPLVAASESTSQYVLPRLSYRTAYYWRIVARDSRGAESSGPVWSFRTMEALQITRPDSGARRRAGVQDTVRWTGGQSPLPVLGGRLALPTIKGTARLLGALAAADSTVVWYSTNNGTNWTRIARSLLPGQQVWTVPYSIVQSARVRVRQYFAGDTAQAISGKFEIYDTLPPTGITVTNPTATSRWEVGTNQTITWTGGTDGWDSISVHYSTNGGTNWARQGRASTPGSYPWTVPTPATTSAMVEIRSFCAGRTTSGRSQRFTTTDPGYPDTLVGTVAIGATPTALCLDSAENLLYVLSGSDPGSATVINCSTDQVVDVVPVGNTPVTAAWSRTSGRVYVANRRGNNVTVIDGPTCEVETTLAVGAEPLSLCWNPANNKLYVAGSADSSITVIDCATNAVQKTVTVRMNPTAMAVRPDRNWLYVANSGSNSVSIIDCANDSLMRTSIVGTQPCAIVSEDEHKAMFIANRGSNTVSIVDSLGNFVPVTVSQQPWSLAWNWTSDKVYSVGNAANQVSVINTLTRAVSATIGVGFQPRDIVWATWANKAYVANFGGGSVSLIDGNSNSVLKTISVGTQPVALIWNPRARKVYVAVAGSGSVAVIGPH
jgi:YVTN family beta-propeller protein